MCTHLCTSPRPAQLFGFERVHLAPSESATVWLYPSIVDFAITSASGERRAHAGKWQVSFGVSEAGAKGMGYTTCMLFATLGATQVED